MDSVKSEVHNPFSMVPIRTAFFGTLQDAQSRLKEIQDLLPGSSSAVFSIQHWDDQEKKAVFDVVEVSKRVFSSEDVKAVGDTLRVWLSCSHEEFSRDKRPFVLRYAVKQGESVRRAQIDKMDEEGTFVLLFRTRNEALECCYGLGLVSDPKVNAVGHFYADIYTPWNVAARADSHDIKQFHSILEKAIKRMSVQDVWCHALCIHATSDWTPAPYSDQTSPMNVKIFDFSFETPGNAWYFMWLNGNCSVSLILCAVSVEGMEAMDVLLRHVSPSAGGLYEAATRTSLSKWKEQHPKGPLILSIAAYGNWTPICPPGVSFLINGPTDVSI